MRVKFAKTNLEKLQKMINDKKEGTFEKSLGNNKLLLELFDQYNIPNKQLETSIDELEKNQIKCIQNIMNDYLISAEDRLF